MPINLKIEPFDNYFRGVASYSEEQGNFEIRVSGTFDDVEAFARTAQIIRLRVEPLATAEFEWHIRLDMEAEQERRNQILQNPNEVWHLLREEQMRHGQNEPLKLPMDRFIEIVNMDNLDKDQIHIVTFHFDPETVVAGKRDVYSTVGRMIWRTWNAVSGVIPGPRRGERYGTVTSAMGIATYDYYGAYIIRDNETIPWWGS